MSSTNQNAEQLTNMLMEEMLRQLNVEQNRQTNEPIQPVTDGPFNLRSFNRLLDTMYDVVTTYNENIREYQENIRNFLVYSSNALLVMRENGFHNNNQTASPRNTNSQNSSFRNRNGFRWNGQPNTRSRFQGNRIFNRNDNNNTRPLRTPANNHMFFSYIFDPLNANANNENSENIRPMNTTEITNTTRTFSCVREELPEDQQTCPITMEPFQTGDVLCEILGCHHIFRRPALMNWLQRSSRCPVCRYTLRSYTPSNTTTTTTTNPPIPSINQFQQQVDNNISNLLSSTNQVSNATPAFDFSFNFTPLSLQGDSNVTEVQNNDDNDSVSDIEQDFHVD